MKNKVSIWIEAARLRTLPLSIAGIIVGNGMAFVKGNFSILIFVFSLLTTILFQVLSNFANDYGDGVKGTDNAARIGPARVIQQGLLTPAELKRGMQWCTLFSLISALVLIGLSFDTSELYAALFFIILGIVSIVAAIKYTVGDSAYGYYALGDVFVFVFFGGLSVLGSFYLQTKFFYLELLLPAISIGLFSTAVLNLNNLRDMENDLVSNKITLPILLGQKNGKRYHYFLIVVGLLCTLFYAYFEGAAWVFFLPLVMIVPFGKHLKRVHVSSGGASFDPELKVVALSTFAFSILLVTAFIIDLLW
ncbi:MAG: 1,4-dihydroxy-2-naphthoate octaprenyltransferase [Polaribacter sp.]|nr:1,4-dihydroxy-2-naphthoate octaprenyltransferase [Flavobacteriaceae bacterium]